MAVILVKDFEKFSADREELNERLRKAGLPVLGGWRKSRCVLYAVRDLDKLKCSCGQIVAKKVGEDEFGSEIYRIGVINGDFVPVLKITVKGTAVEVEELCEDEELLEEILGKWQRKFSYYADNVSSREMSEYVAVKAVPLFKGSAIARNTYIINDDEKAEKLAEIVNSYSPSLFLLRFGEEQKDPIARKLKEKVRSILNRKSVPAVELTELITTLSFLQKEGFDFEEEIDALRRKLTERKKR